MLNCEISFFQKKEPPPKTTSLNSYFSRNTFIRRKTGLLLQTLFFSPTCVHFVLLSLCNQCRQCPSATQQNYTGHFLRILKMWILHPIRCILWVKFRKISKFDQARERRMSGKVFIFKKSQRPQKWICFTPKIAHVFLLLHRVFAKKKKLKITIYYFFWPPKWAKLFLTWSKENQKQFEFS